MIISVEEKSQLFNLRSFLHKIEGQIVQIQKELKEMTGSGKKNKKLEKQKSKYL